MSHRPPRYTDMRRDPPRYAVNFTAGTREKSINFGECFWTLAEAEAEFACRTTEADTIDADLIDYATEPPVAIKSWCAGTTADH